MMDILTSDNLFFLGVAYA